MEQTDGVEDIVPEGVRWPPLGATQSEISGSNLSVADGDYWTSYCGEENEQLWMLEEEQEQLNSALMALTSHFAQVQFRLKQIVDADADSKEKLLKELEEFAFRGIPDFQKSVRCVEGAQNASEDHSQKMESHRLKQQELIRELKQQLENLEQYAYETGEAGLPQTLVVERQKVIIDQMKNKLPLNIDELGKFSLDELRQQVDMAIGELVNPLRMKEQLVSQLKTQVTDLERFIEYLQGPANSSKQCACPVHPPPSSQGSGRSLRRNPPGGASANAPTSLSDSEKNARVQQTMRRVSHLLQMYIVSQFGCGVGIDPGRASAAAAPATMGEAKNKLFHSMKCRIEKSVERILSAHNCASPAHYCSWLQPPESNPELIHIVRKELCPALREMMSHGLVQPTQANVVSLLSCAVPLAPARSPSSGAAGCGSLVHPWHIFVSFYRNKDGAALMSHPQRSLAQSFSLDIQGGTSKQALLIAIGNVIQLHAPYRRGPETHFKAFVSVALNSRKLATWLRIIYRSPNLVSEYYEPWSYAVQTGFDEALKILERLERIDLNLPEDLSIRSLRNMFDAF